MKKIQSLRYLPCSRNQNIARGLSFFEKIEEQGDGFRRMIKNSVDIGLPPPEFNIIDGHFIVIFKGPGESLDGLRSQTARPVYEIQPSIVEVLNEKQKKIMQLLLENKQVQVTQLAAILKVSPQAIRKDMARLQELNLVEKRGSGRSTYYILRDN